MWSFQFVQISAATLGSCISISGECCDIITLCQQVDRYNVCVNDQDELAFMTGNNHREDDLMDGEDSDTNQYAMDAP